MFISENFFDIIVVRTSGLSAEEDVFLKKCACLGDQFGFYLLQAVCPEYDLHSLNKNIKLLMEKNILIINCKHINPEDLSIRESNCGRDVAYDFCMHPLLFSSFALLQFILKWIPSWQKKLLRLFLASKLKDTHILCDSCRALSVYELFNASNPYFRKCLIPKFNFVQCHCEDFKLSVFRNMDLHMRIGGGDLQTRLKLLLNITEIVMDAKDEIQVGKFLEDAEEIIIQSLESPKQNIDVLLKVEFKRLEAKWLFLTEINILSSMDKIGQAFMLLGKAFPKDYARNRFRMQGQEVEFVIQEAGCLLIGCSILLQNGKHKQAYAISGIIEKMHEELSKYSEWDSIAFKRMVELKKLQLFCVPKKKVLKILETIFNICEEQLQCNEKMDIFKFKFIINTYVDIILCLFEQYMLETASQVVQRVHSILKMVNDKKILLHILLLSCLIYVNQQKLQNCATTLVEFHTLALKLKDRLMDALHFCIKSLSLLKNDIESSKLDIINLCKTFVDWKSPICFSNKGHHQKYWIAAIMSLWCLDQGLKNGFNSWYECAQEYKIGRSLLTNFWSISAATKMLVIQIYLLKERLSTYEFKQVGQHISFIVKELHLLEKQAKQYAPIVLLQIGEAKIMIQKISIDLLTLLP